eukprot:m.168548 g.168548  ORF g.168548 m.168548 type:complete len:283 (+) comp38959_c0_seq4:5169-6017(+)
MKKLTAEGHSKKPIQAEPVTKEMEQNLWDQRVFGCHSSQALLYTVFFYVSKCFGLRAVDEHRSLTAESFEFGEDEEGKFIEYVGGKSKNYQGGLQHRKVQPKRCRHYHQAGSSRSFYDHLRRYISLLPKEEKFTGFYKRPIEPGENGELRFSLQNVGVNTLRKFIPTMLDSIGIKGYFTAHSAKVSCATQLYRSGVDEQLIRERTGHRSDAIRQYKRTSAEQQAEVSRLLDPPTEAGEKAVDTAGEGQKLQEAEEKHLPARVMRQLFAGASLANCTLNFNMK